MANIITKAFSAVSSYAGAGLQELKSNKKKVLATVATFTAGGVLLGKMVPTSVQFKTTKVTIGARNGALIGLSVGIIVVLLSYCKIFTHKGDRLSHHTHTTGELRRASGYIRKYLCGESANRETQFGRRQQDQIHKKTYVNSDSRTV